MPPSASSNSRTSTTPQQASGSFPQILYDVLQDAETKGFTDVISWLPDGTGFKVHDSKRFTEEIAPRYFAFKKWKSFQKQCNLYEFDRIFRGPDKNTYSHEHFVRGFPQSLPKLRRQRMTGAAPAHSSSSSQQHVQELQTKLTQELLHKANAEDVSGAVSKPSPKYDPLDDFSTDSPMELQYQEFLWKQRQQGAPAGDGSPLLGSMIRWEDDGDEETPKSRRHTAIPVTKPQTADQFLWYYSPDAPCGLLQNDIRDEILRTFLISSPPPPPPPPSDESNHFSTKVPEWSI
jgi:hypothetical protein